jgi:hypothetical protein
MRPNAPAVFRQCVHSQFFADDGSVSSYAVEQLAPVQNSDYPCGAASG